MGRAGLLGGSQRSDSEGTQRVRGSECQQWEWHSAQQESYQVDKAEGLRCRCSSLLESDNCSRRVRGESGDRGVPFRTGGGRAESALLSLLTVLARCTPGSGTILHLTPPAR